MKQLLISLLTPQSRVLLKKLVNCSAGEEIPCLLWSLKVHYCIQSSPMDPAVI